MRKTAYSIYLCMFATHGNILKVLLSIHFIIHTGKYYFKARFIYMFICLTIWLLYQFFFVSNNQFFSQSIYFICYFSQKPICNFHFRFISFPLFLNFVYLKYTEWFYIHIYIYCRIISKINIIISCLSLNKHSSRCKVISYWGFHLHFPDD